MYIDTCSVIGKDGKKHTRHLLRLSYREKGKVKHRILGNLSKCSKEELEAVRLTPKHNPNPAMGDTNGRERLCGPGFRAYGVSPVRGLGAFGPKAKKAPRVRRGGNGPPRSKQCFFSREKH